MGAQAISSLAFKATVVQPHCHQFSDLFVRMNKLMASSFRGLARAGRPVLYPRAVVGAGFVPVRKFSDYKYTKSHEWIKTEGGVATVGISDFAQGQLGEVVYCDLPSEGSSFSAGETLCTLESVKAVGEVYAPGECEVVEVNEKLEEEPALVNTSCQEEGWLVKVKFTGEPAGLMDSDAYAKHAAAEADAE